MIWAVRMVLVLSAVLSAVFEPRVFFGSGSGGGFLSFSGLYFSGAWWAFRFAVLGLALCGISVFTSGAGQRVGWLEPLVAVVLIAYALGRGVPHVANQSTWSHGDVGVRAWLRGREKQRYGAPVAIGAEAFAGVWRGGDGSTWTFAPNEALRTAADTASTPAAKRAKCSGTYHVVFIERGRDVFADRGIESSSHAAAVVATLPPRVRVPVATVACSNEPWSAEFIRVNDELWLLEPYMAAEEFRDGGFVFRRF